MTASSPGKKPPFEESDLISLGQKMAALDLTDPERSALAALISDDDVAGFVRYDIAGSFKLGLRNLRPPSSKTDGFGVRATPGDPATRSVPGKPGDF